MDSFMKRIGELAELASREPLPAPLDAAGVMLRLRGLSPGFEDDDAMPLKLFSGFVVVAAAAASVVMVFAAGAWADINNPLFAFESLMDVMDALQ